MWNWLLKVDPIGRSFVFYAPLVSVDKFITYARVIVLGWLLGAGEYGVWQLGVMVFSVFAAVATLGTGQGLARYVSYYQARGQLRGFSRRIAWGIGFIAVCTGATAIAFSSQLAQALAGAGQGVCGVLGNDDPNGGLPYYLRLNIVLLALINGLAMGLYINLQSYIRALRTFRLLAVMDLSYTLLFTGIAVVTSVWSRNGQFVLLAHAAVLGLMLAVGLQAAAKALDRVESSHHRHSTKPAAPAALPRPRFRRVLQYGVVAMAGTVVWEFGAQISAWFVYRHHGPTALGIYGTFQQMCQLSWGIAGMAWGLLFSHVASLWEHHRHGQAVATMNLSYKLVVLAMMTATMLALVTAPLWTHLLSQEFRADLALLGGLFMFFQCSANMGMAGIVAQLRERPGVTVLIVLTGVIINGVLAWAWVPREGLEGASRAAGLAMFMTLLLGVLYMRAAQPGLHFSGHFLALTPIILLLPPPIAALLWSLVLALSFATGWVFSPEDKSTIGSYLRNPGGLIRRRAARLPLTMQKAVAEKLKAES